MKFVTPEEPNSPNKQKNYIQSLSTAIVSQKLFTFLSKHLSNLSSILKIKNYWEY